MLLQAAARSLPRYACMSCFFATAHRLFCAPAVVTTPTSAITAAAVTAIVAAVAMLSRPSTPSLHLLPLPSLVTPLPCLRSPPLPFPPLT